MLTFKRTCYMFGRTSFFSDSSLFFEFPRAFPDSVLEVLTCLTAPATLRLQQLRLTSCPNMYPKNMSGESHRGLLTLKNVANITLLNMLC